MTGEAYLPAQQPSTGPSPRFSAPYADTRRPGHRPQPPASRAGASVCVIGRIGDRATFQALRQKGQRTRRGPITVAYLPVSNSDASKGSVAQVRVAFGVGRKVGHAVARNKVRRRLRHIMRELDHRSDVLMPGSYLITVQPAAATMSYGALYQLVAEACHRLGGRREDEGTPA